MNPENTSSDTPIIKVIGVGGGGGNAVAHMYEEGIVGVDFAICNTDAQAMENSNIPTKIALGPKLTEGRGAGAKPAKGKEACIESIEAIRNFLSDNTKMLFITAGMGGGTGTGAAPIIAKAAKEMDVLTVAIVTLPFKFEGFKRQRQALEGLEQLKANVDAILVISNDKLIQIHEGLTIDQAFSNADDILTTAAKGIAEIITVPGKINVDFEDVNTVMKDSGVAIMGNAIADGDDRALKAIEAAINSPLLEDNDIRGAQNILLNISTGNKRATMHEISEIMEYVEGEAGVGTDLFWGDCHDESLGEKMSITFIATGFKAGSKRAQEVKPLVKVPLEADKLSQITGEDSFTITEASNENVFDFGDDDIKSTVEGLGVRTSSHEDGRRHSRDDVRVRERREAPRPRRRHQPSTALDNPQAVAKFENEPAYKRKEIKLENVSKPEEGLSKYSVGIDEGGPKIQRNNSFLHDNVD